MPSGSEASARAEAALVSARRRQRNRDEARPGSGRLREVPSVLPPRKARAEELAATDWASHVDEVPVPSGFGHAERTSPMFACQEMRAKESLKNCEEKLKEEARPLLLCLNCLAAALIEALESERLRRETLRVEGAHWELQLLGECQQLRFRTWALSGFVLFLELLTTPPQLPNAVECDHPPRHAGPVAQPYNQESSGSGSPRKRFSPSLKRIDELRHRRATLETETQRAPWILRAS